MRILSLVVIYWLSFQVANGQDALFSQFNALPVSLNPGLSGAFDGKYRIAGIYRDQWRSALEEPFRTYGLGLDLRFDVDSRGINKDFFSGGIYFQSDKAGFLEYTLNQMYLVGAFHKSLNNSRNQYLGGGIQIGMNQRNVNYSKANFQDQFNGIDGYTLPTLEFLPENNFAHSDFGAGISYIYAPPKGVKFYGGLAVHHIIPVDISLFNRDGNTEISDRGDFYALPMRLTGHVASTLPVSEFLDFQPRGMFAVQGETMQYNIGALFKFYFLEADRNNLYVGAFLRGAAGVNNWASDMVGAVIGYGLDNMMIGMSYDFSINSISRFGRSRGSFELSISYFGNYENEEEMCPFF